jgi:dissimilatory sulfite reductase (desulfoviridin) alpha/beta subunit
MEVVFKVLILKSCPKCKTGAIGVDRDQYGWYEYCIQCGYVRDLIDMAELVQEQAGGAKERRRGVRISGKGE